MKITKPLIASAAIITIASLALATPALAAQDAVGTTRAGVVVAEDTAAHLLAQPTAPNTLTVTVDPKASVKLTPTTRGAHTQTKKADARGKAVFTNLTAGRTYRVTAEGETTTAMPMTKVGRATNLTVRTTDTPTAVELSWQHTTSPARGGASIRYEVKARPVAEDGQIISAIASQKSVLLEGLNPKVIYEFSVIPLNPISRGQASVARMNAPLSALVTTPAPAQPVPVTPRSPERTTTPASNAAPAPAPAPAPNVIYVCPAGYADAGANCRKALDYTYTTRAYTYHDAIETSPYTYRTEVIGPAPVIDSFETQADACPSGYNLENYGAQGKFCRLYGPAPTAQVKNAPPAGWTDNGTAYQRTIQVKDSTPAGFSDDGTQWIKKDAAPAGFVDDGTQYVSTVSKQPQVI